MEAVIDGRGFAAIEHDVYASEPAVKGKIIQESSAIGDYDEGYKYPGSSYLWIGNDFHLDREEVAGLIALMQEWLKNKRLTTDPPRD